MDLIQLFQQLLVAIGTGGLIGVERERTGKPVGFRTFILISMFGFLCALINQPLIGLIGTILFAIAPVVARGKGENVGETTVVAEIITYILGYLAGTGELIIPSAIAAVTATILAMKRPMHEIAQSLSQGEMNGILELVLVSSIILPILPTTTFDPMGILTPFLVWLFVIFIFGISVMAYIILKRLPSEQGPIAIALGGLVSSTATSITLLAKQKAEQGYGVVLSDCAMLLRVLIILLALSPALGWSILVPFLISIVIGTLYSYPKLKQIRKFEIRSPITLVNALGFAILLVIILIGSEYTLTVHGTLGVEIVMFITSLINMDVALITLASLMTKAQLTFSALKYTVLGISILNLIAKIGLAWIFNKRTIKTISIGLAMMIVPLVAAYFL